MLTLLKYMIYIPLAVLLVAFAVANHEFVMVSLDPFSGRENAALQLRRADVRRHYPVRS